MRIYLQDLQNIEVFKSINITEKILNDPYFIKDFIESKVNFIQISDNFHHEFYRSFFKAFKKIQKTNQFLEFINQRISNHHRLHYELLFIPKNNQFSWHIHANIEFGLVLYGVFHEIRPLDIVVSKKKLYPGCSTSKKKASKKGTLRKYSGLNLITNEIGSIHKSYTAKSPCIIFVINSRHCYFKNT